MVQPAIPLGRYGLTAQMRDEVCYWQHAITH
jgi:hypothetical protein